MRWVAFSSIFAGITGYLVILMATLCLGAERFESFNVFWGLFFALSGTIQGLMHETTRGVRRALSWEQELPPATDELALPDPHSPRIPEAQRAQPMRVAAIGGVVVMLVVGATSFIWAPALLSPDSVVLGAVLGTVGTLLLTWQAGLAGLLSGSARWRAFGLLLTAEAALRIVVAAIAMVSGDPLSGFLYATVAGTIATPFCLFATKAGRAVMPLRTDVGSGAFIRRSLSAMLAASAAAVLVAGFPVILKATRSGADAALLSNLLLAVTLTRAPILVPLTSFQNAIVVYFVDRSEQGRAAIWRPIALVVGIAVIGAGLAWLVGPPIIALMGKGFAVDGSVLAALTLASAATGILYLTGSATLARERHTSYVAGWWCGIVATIVLLVAIPDLTLATILSLMIGPAIGAVVHIAVGMRSERTADAR